MNGTEIADTGTGELPDDLPDIPLCYRLPAAGQVLGGISRRKVHDLIEAGELEITWVGTLRMVTRDSIKAYIERRKSATKETAK